MRAHMLGGLVASCVLLAAGTAMAHHSFAAEFDANKPVTLTGRVTKVEWTNPHVWFYFNVKDAKIGEEITVVGSRAKNGSNRMNARQVTLTSTGGRPGETLDAVSSQGQASANQ